MAKNGESGGSLEPKSLLKKSPFFAIATTATLTPQGLGPQDPIKTYFEAIQKLTVSTTDHVTMVDGC